jgi:AcrR family transcriptional regulator
MPFVTVSDSPRRTQAERRASSEEALLAAAAELIAEHGIEGASLARIGARAGASRGLPTHHFGSKDALVARLAREAQDRITAASAAALERAGQDAGQLSGLALVRRLVDTYLGLFEDPSPEVRALLVMWGATFPAHSAVTGMLEAERRSYDGWADLIRRGQRDGSIRADLDPTATAVMLFGMTRGVAALLATDAAVADMTDVRRDCDAFLRAALTPAGAT